MTYLSNCHTGCSWQAKLIFTFLLTSVLCRYSTHCISRLPQLQIQKHTLCDIWVFHMPNFPTQAFIFQSLVCCSLLWDKHVNFTENSITRKQFLTVYFNFTSIKCFGFKPGSDRSNDKKCLHIKQGLWHRKTCRYKEISPRQ